MHSRLAALVLSGILSISFAGCSKKENTQASQPPATTTDQAAPPAAAPSPSQPASTTPGPNSQPPAAQPAPPGSNETAQSVPPPAPAAAPEPPPPPPPIVVPAGSTIVIRMGSGISSKTANVGDTFRGTLAHSITAKGAVAIPAGAGVSGTVTNVKSPGKFKGEGVLSITLTAINVRGEPVSIQTSSYTQTVKGKGKRTAVLAGGGAGVGALIGGLAGGGKGAAIGALAGGGAGTAGAAFTGNKELEIPAESAVTFKLASPITVRRPAKAEAQAQDQTQ